MTNSVIWQISVESWRIIACQTFNGYLLHFNSKASGSASFISEKNMDNANDFRGVEQLADVFVLFFPADPWFARYGFYSKWRLIKSIFRPAVSKLGRWGPYSVLACRAYLGAHCAHTPTYVIWCCLYFLWRQNITLPYPVGRMSDTILFAFWEVCIVWWKFIMPDCP